MSDLKANEKVRDRLRELAKRETWMDSDDFNPCDFSGGNFDDAYYAGCKDGKTELAKELLKELFNE